MLKYSVNACFSLFLFVLFSQNSIAEVPPQPWSYPAGNMGVLNIANGYTNEDFISVATQYINVHVPINFAWSNLIVNCKWNNNSQSNYGRIC